MHDLPAHDRSRPGNKTLSDYWRRNCSTREAIEMANIMQSLRKVTGHLGPNAGTVEYIGMSRPDPLSILVDPAAIMGCYPVPAEKVDMLIGTVIHEAMHRKEWSDHVWKLLEPDFAPMGSKALIKFQKVVHTGEDIYVDSVLEASILGEYLARAREKALMDVSAGLERKGPSIDGLVVLWWAGTWGMDGLPLSFQPYEECLNVLSGLGERLKDVRGQSGVVNRCGLRAGIFREAWLRLSAMVEDLAVIDRRLFRYEGPATTAGNTGNAVRQGPDSGQSITPDLVHEIEHHLATGSTDITPLIEAVVGPDCDEVVPTSRWDFPVPVSPVIDHRLVARLKAVFSSYSRHEAVWSRGLQGGRVDGRRLYRAAVNGRCFKLKQTLPDPSWDITLIIDASGSMRGMKWKIVESTVASLHRALSGCKGRFQAYAYFESDGICMISSLIKDGRVHTTIPAGRTASGQAIIAAGLMMPDTKRRNLLIHITDGESNMGCPVKYGIGYCKRRGIPLVTLGCGCRDREAMKVQYRGAIDFLDSFKHLPAAVELLLQRTFLYGRGAAPRERLLYPGQTREGRLGMDKITEGRGYDAGHCMPTVTKGGRHVRR